MINDRPHKELLLNKSTNNAKVLLLEDLCS